MTDDTISRAAALNIAHTLIIPGEEFHQNNQAIGNYTAELVKLPSAQPVAKDINVPVKDCISRATAIETVRKAKSIGQAHRMLVQLPSALSEQTDCEYCHEDSDGCVRSIEKNSHAWLVRRGRTMKLRVRFKGGYSECDILFCPMCGRRLTDG